MEAMNVIALRFDELLELLPKFKNNSKESIVATAMSIANAFESGRKILICGNGGSAADSQHFAAEFVNIFSREINRRALPALALSTDTSIITAIANDSSYDQVFARQVEAYAEPGDVVIAFTTSGSSQNCINAVVSAKAKSAKTIAFTCVNAEISKLVDISLEVPSSDTQHIQECHIIAYHIIAELVENQLFVERQK
jgi:D-sedoheptulose 7-phosphate isomerase